MSNFNIVEYIGNQQEFFAPVLSDDSIRWEKEKQFAIQAFQGNNYLEGVARKNPASLQNAIINIATIGISLNPAVKHAYLVPRKGGICLDISYMGLLHIAQSSGVILWGQSKLVYSNDNYENIGIDKAPTHKVNTFGDRGEIVGVYCTVKTVDGDFLTEEMQIKDVYDIRNRSEAFKSGKSCPWLTDEGEMIRKTVVKRAYKYWPKCERLGEAIQMINDNGEGLEKDITPVELINADQVDVLLPLLCDESGNYTNTGQKLCRAHRFNNLNEIKACDYDQILKAAS